MFLHSNITLDNSAIFNRCLTDIKTYNLTLTPTNEGRILNNCFSSWKIGYELQHDNQPHNWPELRPLIAEINSKGCNIIDGSWFVILGKDSWVIPHWHPSHNLYVCVYNVIIDSEHPDLEFFNSNTNSWEPSKCKPGDYIIFEGTHKHKIDLQCSSKLRCMISINC